MTRCKSCGRALSDAAAAASVFRLSSLPLRGQRLHRRETMKIAEAVGPLCEVCVDRCKDLAAEGEIAPLITDHSLPTPCETESDAELSEDCDCE